MGPWGGPPRAKALQLRLQPATPGLSLFETEEEVP